MKIIATILVSLLFVAASPEGYQVGDTVDASILNLKLKNVTGKMISLADYNSSKGVILIFDCNTCPYSKAYNERIIALHTKYASKGYPVVAIQPNDPQISPGDSFEEMVKRAESKKYAFAYLLDETQKVSRSFGATNTPHVFVLKNTGKEFNVAYIGAIDDNSRDASAVTKRYVEDAIDALLASKDVPASKTKAIGCSIKWKNV